MNVLVSKSKELNQLTYGDKLFRLLDKQVYPLNDIIVCSEGESDVKKTYYYFKHLGLVRDKVMRKMFKMNTEGFVLSE